MTMQWDHYSFRIAEHYLSALINGDESGMTDDEARELSDWVCDCETRARADGFAIGHWADIDGTGEDWGRCEVSGLFAMRTEVRLMVYTKT